MQAGPALPRFFLLYLQLFHHRRFEYKEFNPQFRADPAKSGLEESEQVCGPGDWPGWFRSPGFHAAIDAIGFKDRLAQTPSFTGQGGGDFSQHGFQRYGNTRCRTDGSREELFPASRPAAPQAREASSSQALVDSFQQGRPNLRRREETGRVKKILYLAKSEFMQQGHGIAFQPTIPAASPVSLPAADAELL